MIKNSVEILLVEDNSNDELLALHEFKKHNLADRFHVVRDGAEALEFVFCTGSYAERPFENPRMILLDRKLPKVDGIEVLRQIRADPRTRLVPVVMLTSAAEDREVIESYELGVNGYIIKPVDLSAAGVSWRDLGLKTKTEKPSMVEKSVEILLVEDNANDEMLALHAFKKHNLVNKVHVVRDGAEALEFVFCTGAYAGRRFENPRVILLDKKLPLVDGLDVLRQIRVDARTRLVPVVMLTSSAEDRDIIESYQLGVNSYIVKPVDFEQFTETARQLGYYWLLINKQPPDLA